MNLKIIEGEFKELVYRYYKYDIVDTTNYDHHGNVIPKYTQGLTLGGFIEFFKDSIKEKGEDKVWEWFENWGYDKDLYLVGERSFIITKHSILKFESKLEEVENSVEMNYEN